MSIEVISPLRVAERDRPGSLLCTLLSRIRPVTRAIMARADGYRAEADHSRPDWEATCMHKATAEVLGDEDLVRCLLDRSQAVAPSDPAQFTESGPGHFQAYAAMVRRVRLVVARMQCSSTV